MKLETKSGVRTVTLSKREQKTLVDCHAVVIDLQSIGETSEHAVAEIAALVDKFCETATEPAK